MNIYTIQGNLIGLEEKAQGLFFKSVKIWKLEALIFTSKKIKSFDTFQSYFPSLSNFRKNMFNTVTKKKSVV